MDKKVTIEIIKLGVGKYDEIIERFIKYGKRSSSIFRIETVKKVALPNSEHYTWGYLDNTLERLFPETTCDIQIGILDYPIEANYFSRKLSSKRAVLSFYQVDEYLAAENIDLLNFLLVTTYEIVTMYVCNQGQKTEDINFCHDETRGCIFDMCGIKTNIVAATSNPKVCLECESAMNQLTLDSEYLKTLKLELSKIKKPLYYSIVAWVKKHPLLSVLMTILSSVAINVISNILYDCMKKYM